MKKKIFSILTVVCIVLLSGCEKRADLQVYEYSGANDDNSIFDYSGEVYEEEEIISEIAPEETRSLLFQGTEYELNYQETEHRQFFPYMEHFYTSEEHFGFTAAFRSDTNQLSKIVSKEGISLANVDVPVIEEDFRTAADTLLKDYIRIEDYTCTCVTEISHFAEENGVGSRWYETKDYFYDGIVAGETKQYVFTYTKYLNGFRTSDAAEITFNADGTLSSMQLLNIGAFDKIDKIGVSEKSVQTAIEDKLNQICMDGYQIENFRQELILGIEQSGRLFFVVSARPTVSAIASRTASNQLSEETCVFILTVEEEMK